MRLCCASTSSSKTDSVGCLVSRTHKCYCSVVPKHICPFHVALLFAKDKVCEGDSPLFPASGGGVLTKQETIDVIRSVQKSRVPLTRPGAAGSEPVSLFHGHCLRVSLAQLLSRLTPVSTIMLLGRWGSKSIERYIQEAELESFDISAQADGLDAVASLPKRPHLDNQSSGPAASATSVFEQRASQLAELARKVEELQIRPDFIVAKKAHTRDKNESRPHCCRPCGEHAAVGNMRGPGSCESVVPA